MAEDAHAPVSIERKTDEIRDSIHKALVEHGSATVDVHDIRISLDEWRKLARKVARELGRPVETIASDRQAWAALRDWPADAREQQVHETAMRRAMESTWLPPLPPGSSNDE